MSVRVFRNASGIAYGCGALGQLAATKGRRALLLTGQGAMERSGTLGRATAFLQQAGAEVRVVGGIRPDPPIEQVEAMSPAVLDFRPDTFVALGGGSVIDSARALWAFYEHPELGARDLFKPHVSRPIPLPGLGTKARLIAIPSTSGTGSETSGVSVLVEAASRTKLVLLSAELVPTLAICDPDAAQDMPSALAAHTGMDALTHALEAAVSPWATDFSEPLALRALELIFAHLRAACRDGDRPAREKMHYAATLAGMAINNSITGLAHGMDKIGLHFGLSHGLTCAVLLPHTVRFSAAAAGPGYARIARRLGVRGESDAELTAALVERLTGLLADIGIPRGFGELGIDRRQYEDAIDRVSDSALQAGPTVFSPRVPTPEELRQIYMQAYHGE